jgi:hypothetical protein
VVLRGAKVEKSAGFRLWSQNVRDHNSFDNPERVQPASFTPELKGPHGGPVPADCLGRGQQNATLARPLCFSHPFWGKGEQKFDRFVNFVAS